MIADRAMSSENSMFPNWYGFSAGCMIVSIIFKPARCVTKMDMANITMESRVHGSPERGLPEARMPVAPAKNMIAPSIAMKTHIPSNAAASIAPMTDAMASWAKCAPSPIANVHAPKKSATSEKRRRNV